MNPETEELILAAESQICSAVRLLYQVCGEQSGMALANEFVAEHFRIETARRESTPILSGLVLH